MKDLLLKIALNSVKTILLPAIQKYAEKTPNKIDDLVVQMIAAILDDPNFIEQLKLAA